MTVVRQELTVRVQALAQTLAIPVAYENNTFTKPINYGSFLEMFIIPAATIDWATSGLRQREVGLMQINIWCKTGNGTAAADAIFDGIKTAFPLVPKTGQVSIEATPSMKTAIIDSSGYRIVPVIIPYRLEASI